MSLAERESIKVDKIPNTDQIDTDLETGLNYEPTEEEIAQEEDNLKKLDLELEDPESDLQLYYRDVFGHDLLGEYKEKIVIRKAKKEMQNPRFMELLNEDENRKKSIQELISLNTEIAQIAPNWQRMINANLRLVNWQAQLFVKKTPGSYPHLLDFIQEGNIGLMRALEKFDPSRGYKFSTYAVWWIKQSIRYYWINNKRTIRLPAHLNDFLERVEKTERSLVQILGRAPTEEEIAVELNTPPKKVADVKSLPKQNDLSSLNAAITHDDEDGILANIVPDVKTNTEGQVTDISYRQELAEYIEKILESRIFNSREKILIRLKYLEPLRENFDPGHVTYEQIAPFIGVNSRSLGVIEKTALRKFRHPNIKESLSRWLGKS